MPNHFHFLINTDQRTILTKVIAGKEKNILSEGIRMLLSSYTLAINKQNDTTGSLFQQNTKAKSIAKEKHQHAVLCFHYIHQNPMRAKLVKKMEDWEYSSFRDYCSFRNGTLCNQELAVNILGINKKTFYNDSYKIIREDNVKHIL
jgi:putative transposase